MKYESFVALLIVCVLSQIYPVFGQDIKTGRQEIVYNGNKFVLEPQNRKDTVTIVDVITGETKTVVTDASPFPVSMNGKHIYTNTEVDVPSGSRAPNISLEEEIINNLKGFFDDKPVPDGILQLEIKQVIIDEHGKVVYSDFHGMKLAEKDDQFRSLTYDNPDILFKNTTQTPATYKDHSIISSRRVFMDNYIIEIKDHKLTYHKI